MDFVRIVILNYNSSQYTLNIINYLKSQTFQNFEIVVVDNASNKNESEILKLLLPKSIECIYSKINLGYSGGNNLGMRIKTNNEPDFYFILNNDIIIDDNKLLKELLESFKFNNRIIAVSPLVDTISTKIPLDKQIQVRRILPLPIFFFVCCTIFKLFTKKAFEKYIYFNDMPYLNKYLLCDSINGAAFLIDAKFMKQNNYLDEGTFLFFEEIILGRQILDAGGTCLLNGKTSLKHLQGVSSKSTPKKINIIMEKYKRESELYYFKKYCGLNKFNSFLFIKFKKIELLLKKIIY
jgi:GT2 family glycosyltransferase